MATKMSNPSSRGFVLGWQRAVVGHLSSNRPLNHTSVLAVAAVLVTHADRDGKNVFPSQQTIGREAGLHHSTVSEALRYLEHSGLIRHVRNRERGLREYQLQVADEPITGAIQNAHQLTPEQPDRGSGRGSDRGPSIPTSGDLRGPRSNSSEPSEEILQAARKKVAELKRSGRSIQNEEAYAQAIARSADFQATYYQSLERERDLKEKDLCPRCDKDGLLWLRTDGAETSRDDPEATISDLCDHMGGDLGLMSRADSANHPN